MCITPLSQVLYFMNSKSVLRVSQIQYIELSHFARGKPFLFANEANKSRPCFYV